MNYKKGLVGLLLLLITNLAYAGSWYGFATGGITRSRVANSKNVPVNASITNRYVPRTTNNLDVLVGAGINHSFEDFYRDSNYNLTIALAAYFMDLGSVDGTKYPNIGAGPSPTLKYHYSVSSSALFVEPRFSYRTYDWQPYVLAGFGPTWNHLYDYQEIPNAGATPANKFRGNWEQDFGYEFGFGLQKEFVSYNSPYSIVMSLDYRCIDTGTGSFKPIALPPINRTLEVKRIFMHALVLTIGTSL